MKQPSTPAYEGRVKYSESKARSYQSVKERKNRAELKLVTRAFRLVPTGSVLDAPCGGGRVSLLLASKGYQMRSADLSEPMRAIARENFGLAGLSIPVDAEDVEQLSYTDQSFDASICFRLFHHFPNPRIRQRVIMELCRVTRRHVALSYFSPNSVTSLQRRWRAAWGGRKSQKFATPLGEVEAYFDAAGFQLVRDFARLPLIHTLHLALFERADA
jgi:2-polyprenyl-3-methyl-5-hydroxy-6-metoxy-1,4-benzoquinol methylase